MRTIISLDDQLHRRAKAYVARHGKTLTALVDEALRMRMAQRNRERRPPVRLPTFQARACRAGPSLDDMGTIYDRLDNCGSARDNRVAPRGLAAEGTEERGDRLRHRLRSFQILRHRPRRHDLGLKDFRERLQPGTSITISGWPATDPEARAFSGRDVTFADGSTMLFGPTPNEGDRWSCASGPCSYTYLDARSQ